jgi:hypothetical protein
MAQNDPDCVPISTAKPNPAGTNAVCLLFYFNLELLQHLVDLVMSL